MEQKIQAFGLASRRGMEFLSLGETEYNFGVETGAEVLLKTFSLAEKKKLLAFSPPKTELQSISQSLQAVVEEYREGKKTVLQMWEPDTTPVFFGGDHSISLMTVASVLTVFPAESVGLIQFDSHGDLHQPETSPSGNLHGMWLRAVLDEFSFPQINTLIPNKISPQKYQLIGNPVLEEEEINFLKHHNRPPITSQELKNPEIWKTRLETIFNTTKHIHISFDIDVFAKKYAPGTGTPNEKGLSPEEIWPVVDFVRQKLQEKNHTWSMDVVELNPKKDFSGNTFQLCQEVLHRFFSEE